jgi:hypothetical protein
MVGVVALAVFAGDLPVVHEHRDGGPALYDEECTQARLALCHAGIPALEAPDTPPPRPAPGLAPTPVPPRPPASPDRRPAARAPPATA